MKIGENMNYTPGIETISTFPTPEQTLFDRVKTLAGFAISKVAPLFPESSIILPSPPDVFDGIVLRDKNKNKQTSEVTVVPAEDPETVRARDLKPEDRDRAHRRSAPGRGYAPPGEVNSTLLGRGSTDGGRTPSGSDSGSKPSRRNKNK